MKTNFSRYISTVFVILMATVLFGCSKDEPECSTPDSINDSKCSKQIPPVDQRPVTLNITFKDSVFFDQNSRQWMTIQKNRLSGGTFGITVPIYSNFLNLSRENVLNKVILAEDQKERPNNYREEDFNYIPYIEIEPEDGAEYLYNYVKKDLNNNVIFEKNDKVPVINGRVVLPLTNVMFNNQFYSTNSSLGARFVHSLTFAAQSKNKKGVLSSVIDFETSFQIPPTDFLVDYSGDMENFNLDNRWSFYFKDSDYNPNEFFKFFTLKEKKELPEQIPLDIKIIFQSPPTLNMEQEIFFELPFDYETFRTTQTIVPLRGSRFYSKTTTLNSNTDFKMNIKINNETVDVNETEVEYLNLPAGTPWNIEFYYNMNENEGYSPNPTTGIGLLTPLRPICSEFTNSSYMPISEEGSKRAAIEANGYISICHPALNKKVIVPAGTSNVDLVDSWFNFFSYIPYNQFNKDLGHFYGIKKVRFYSEGCFRVYTREVGTNSYLMKSKGHPKCGEAQPGQSDSGWVYYYAERVFTIFDNMNAYESVDGLKPLMQTFSSRPTITDESHFLFNGLLNDFDHVY